jgi:hypothetical protein
MKSFEPFRPVATSKRRGVPRLPAPFHSRLIGELAHVTGGLLATIENEDPGPTDSKPDRVVQFVIGEFPLYRRNWNHVFTDFGLTEVLCESSKPDGVRSERPTVTEPVLGVEVTACSTSL